MTPSCKMASSCMRHCRSGSLWICLEGIFGLSGDGPSVMRGLVAAEAREDAEGWVDGLLMTAHIAAGQQLHALASALGAG